MIFLALTQEGLKEALTLAKEGDDAIWCTSKAITEQEFEESSESNISRFDYSFDLTEIDLLIEALSTIKEHHPGERVWIDGGNEL